MLQIEREVQQDYRTARAQKGAGMGRGLRRNSRVPTLHLEADPQSTTPEYSTQDTEVHHMDAGRIEEEPKGERRFLDSRHSEGWWEQHPRAARSLPAILLGCSALATPPKGDFMNSGVPHPLERDGISPMYAIP